MSYITNTRNQLNGQALNKNRHWLSPAFERNERPQLIIKVTEIIKDSKIDVIIKARNLVRKYPELRWDVYVRPTNPDSISQMKPADASIDSYDKAMQYILAAELKGLL